MRIGELSRRTRIPARMLRYYEEQGLLRPGREENGYRCYGPGTVELVQQIRGLLDAGLTTTSSAASCLSSSIPARSWSIRTACPRRQRSCNRRPSGSSAASTAWRVIAMRSAAIWTASAGAVGDRDASPLPGAAVCGPAAGRAESHGPRPARRPSE